MADTEYPEAPEPLHVAMSAELHDSLSERERLEAWQSLIKKAGVAGPYMPIPFRDDTRDIIGMNIVRIGANPVPHAKEND